MIERSGAPALSSIPEIGAVCPELAGKVAGSQTKLQLISMFRLLRAQPVSWRWAFSLDPYLKSPAALLGEQLST
jgi:hypothetical protein